MLAMIYDTKCSKVSSACRFMPQPPDGQGQMIVNKARQEMDPSAG
jgi:hypothetical protein